MSETLKRRRQDDASGDDLKSSAPRQRTTVYDAVAGRVNYEGYIIDKAPSRTRDYNNYSNRAVAPEEVLFRQKGAPIRYEEDDIYFAERHLDGTSQRLPDSDMLKHIHTYASDFYQRGTKLRGKWDFCSMDETALIAIAILVEETLAEKLGSTGDLAFIEGDDADSGSRGARYWDGERWVRSVIANRSTTGDRKASRPQAGGGDDAVEVSDEALPDGG